MRDQLRLRLGEVWPELDIIGEAKNGEEAVELVGRLKPDLTFLDIRMPGTTGMEAARQIGGQSNIVFVTAYDQYAIQAFEAQAMDYLLKPVQAARLQKTVSKLQLALANRTQPAIDFEATLGQLRGLLGAGPHPAATPLRVIQASVGTTIRMVPVEDVIYFEAADKYVRVLTASHEYLIRTPLKELLPQLDANTFWQIHRGTVVNAACIDTVTRDEAGKLNLTVRARDEKLPVSRLYAHLFKAM